MNFTASLFQKVSLFRAYFFVFLIILGVTAPAYSLNLKIISQKTTISQIKDTILENQKYVSIDFIQHLFNNIPTLSLTSKKWKITSPSAKKWSFTVDNPFVFIRQKAYNLIYPVYALNTDVFIPLQAALVLLKIHEFNFIQYDYKSNTVTVKPLQADITEVLLNSKNNGDLISIPINSNITYDYLWSKPYYIITFNGIMDTTKINNLKLKSKLIKSITATQNLENSQLALEINLSIDPVEINYDSKKKELNLVIRKQNHNLKPAKNKKKTKKTIIIDPGHGGKDPGAVYNNYLEKNVTLAVSLKLQKKLERMGYKVLLTRSNDTFISLKERPKFAANNGGDLFISIHANAIAGSRNKKEKVHGYIAYILRSTQDKEDQALANRENLASQTKKNADSKKSLSDVDWFLLEHELNLYTQESEQFALSIVKQFEKQNIIKKYKTGARQAGFFVLVGAFMPAVLFEIGFLSNSKDRKNITNKKGQEIISTKLAQAIDQYFQLKK